MRDVFPKIKIPKSIKQIHHNFEENFIIEQTKWSKDIR